MRKLIAVAGVLAAVAAPSVAVSASSGATNASVGLTFVKTGKPGSAIWVAGADGSAPRKLASGDEALLSPNGALVAANQITGTRFSLAIFKLGGGQVTLPAALARPQIQALAWSPDSRYLAIAVQGTGLSGPNRSSLDVIDTTTGAITVHVPGVVAGASFKPDASDTVVFGLTHSFAQNAQINLFTVAADGTGGTTQLTTNGHSSNPVWGKLGIVYDLITPRKIANQAQLYLLNGSTNTQITHLKVAPLLFGLAPLAISADGTKLVANLVGEDTDQGYTVDLTTKKVTELTVKNQENTAYGISSDGTRVLVSYGGFEAPSTHAVVATMPFGGGTPTTLITGGYQASWNQ